MASIEKKIGAAILAAIRKHRDESTLARRVQTNSAGASPAAKVREADFSDFPAVADLKQRWNMAADSLENWERLWQRNPAFAGIPSRRPIGWVLEADGKIVGYLGSVSLLSRFRERSLSIVASHGLVVEPAYRSVGVSLVAAFYRQKADLYVVTSALPEVGKIARAFKSDPIPQADYDSLLFWVLRPAPFAKAVMKKLGVRLAVQDIGTLLGSLALATDTTLRRRRPSGSSADLSIQEIAIDEIGDDFQQFWIEKAKETPRLLSERSAATLRWHFEIPGDRGYARVLSCYRNGKLEGYAVVRTDVDNDNGLRTSIIADMIAKKDDPAVVRALFVAAYQHAQHAGSHVFEVQGFPSDIREICSKWRPYRRSYPACPYYYKAADPVLHKALADPMAWYACPFDGDATLIRPSYPTRALRVTRDEGTKGAQPHVPEHLSESQQTHVF